MILLVILVSSLIKISFAQLISSISKSCFQNIRDLRRIRSTIDQTTACTIMLLLSFILNLTNCNSLLLNLPAIQTNRLQFVLNVMQTGRSVIKSAAVVRDLGVWSHFTNSTSLLFPSTSIGCVQFAIHSVVMLLFSWSLRSSSRVSTTAMLCWPVYRRLRTYTY